VVGVVFGASDLGWIEAVVLGLVEGLTEYLPVSSTGHLLVASRLLGLGGDGRTERALDTYAICIQSGAILAVLVLYRHRTAQLVQGAVGRSPGGRRILVALAVAFAPAAVTGFLAGAIVKSLLFGVVPVAVAWMAGGLFILGTRDRPWTGGGKLDLELIGARQAAVIGLAQTIALWPGISRSLVTILAALFVGCSMKAAVEFSFLLGLVTLGAATAYEALRSGSEVIEVFGVAAPALGLVVAFAAALTSIRWMVGWLETRSLDVFGWYRIGIGTVVLLAVAVP
jgi:undecaprenyl-diphosphatase